MFSIGDKIAYPMHGAGIIEAIEENTILGEQHSYYVVHVAHTDMKIMVPVDTSDKVGVRFVVDADVIPQVKEVLGGETGELPTNWNRRYRENMERLKTGDILVVAGVVRDLLRADRIKKLSAGEKKLLTTSKQILASEVVLSTGMSYQEANDFIDDAV